VTYESETLHLLLHFRKVLSDDLLLANDEPSFKSLFPRSDLWVGCWLRALLWRIKLVHEQFVRTTPTSQPGLHVHRVARFELAKKIFRDCV